MLNEIYTPEWRSMNAHRKSHYYFMLHHKIVVQISRLGWSTDVSKRRSLWLQRRYCEERM